MEGADRLAVGGCVEQPDSNFSSRPRSDPPEHLSHSASPLMSATLNFDPSSLSVLHLLGTRLITRYLIFTVMMLSAVSAVALSADGTRQSLCILSD